MKKKTDKIQEVLNSIVDAFEKGTIPEAIAIATFPSPEGLPSSKWSIRNRTIMALSGTVDARGFNQWKEVNRYVKKGSKSIHILVPCFKKESDEDTGQEETILKFFKAMPVFRVEDTDGEPLDYLDIELPDLPLIERALEWGINVKAVPGNMEWYGYFSPARKEIGLATPSLKTYLHELSHAADHIIKGKLKPGQNPLQEVTAELAAQALCRLVGKSMDDTTGNSYRYIKRYAEKIKTTPVKACLRVLSDVEKILNLILHNNVNGISTKQQSAA